MKNEEKIVFRSGSLRMGGLERVLIEVLQTINKDKYEDYLGNRWWLWRK